MLGDKMRVFKIFFFLTMFSGSIQFVLAQEPNQTLTNADILNMSKSGISDQIILLSIQKAATKFDTSPDALIHLKTAGISDAVMGAMLTASSAGVKVTQRDCSQMLDKVLASVGTKEKLGSVQSTQMFGKSFVSRAGGTTEFQLDRVTNYLGSIHVSLRPTTGIGSTIVITPDFNYLISGKMTTSIPASVLQDIMTTFKLEPIYISQHRGEYSCVSGGTEQIGSATTAKLVIKGGEVAGVFNADPETGRLLRTTYQSSSTGQSVIDFSDWRMVDDIYLSFKRHVVTSSTNTEILFSEFKVNPVVDVVLFQPPGQQVAASVTLKVLQSESVPYTVQTNGGISTACNISGSTSTSLTTSTYGNMTYGNASSTPSLQMNCKSTDTTIRWTHVLNAMFVQASDGNAYIIACDRAWAWSKCKPLRTGDTFLASRGDKGFVVQSYNGKSKEQEATYSILQSKAPHE